MGKFVEKGTWETPFDESMLIDKVIIACPSRDAAERLFDIFDEYGIGWYAARSDRTMWSVHREFMCYRVYLCRGELSLAYGKRSTYETEPEYQHYLKCTFYGEKQMPEISGDCFESILAAGG